MEEKTWIKVEVSSDVAKALRVKAIELDSTVKGVVEAAVMRFLFPGLEAPLPRDRRRAKP